MVDRTSSQKFIPPRRQARKENPEIPFHPPEAVEKNPFMVREPHHERISGTKFQAVSRSS
jgi:hypothetical protein